VSARDESPAEVAFSAYISTLTPGRVKRERWLEPISVTRQKQYDQETERQRAIIHNGRNQAS